jgi:2-hydroxy-6-oxonona-2,4-dienedioate hydrolase
MTTGQRTFRWYAVRAMMVIALAVVGGAALVYLRFRQDIAAHEERIARGSRIADTPCGSIEYGEMGEGRPILALHGAGGGYDQGLLLGRGLGSGFRIIAPSRFGYMNTPIPEDSSVEAQADAYACLLEALNVDRVSVVADSAGGPSALAFALRHPDRVNALVLVSAISTLRPIRDDSSGPSAAVLTDFVYWLAVTYFPDTAISALGVPAESLGHISTAAHEEMWFAMRSFQPMSRRMPGMNLEVWPKSG